ncbi:ABC transporter ATP-binding protein [Limnospira platensis NIES-39]|jgi:phospholipid/cholesterol/gamma-HCH transport system ATP-binding protein|uniref:ABC transporter ATP-binding protein n=2 Tax=Oscillatoriophycideae TaxID=1301283 RepID=A0A5M3TAZ9_LIMPL|nr:ABC transporter ATP-binding protein [Arthrospira platensis NIES-39]BDT12678.1 ABC transporter ATP-binding protein [Arthrospira platensis NIES-39]GCE95141.1 ABC transporter ATP-binding protein [Arthrospira platensis NIES-46]
MGTESKSNMSEPLIELRGISKTFGSNVILDGVDLSIYQGQALGIIGPSGTGKSTILRIIAGLLPPDAGEVYVKGQLRRGWVDDLSDPIGIGMVFQNAALFDSLNVEQNVGFRLYEHSRLSQATIRQLVEERLEMVGLPNICDRYPAELSGGMRKRVSFARAIMPNPENPSDNPEVILYDEPTAGLDPIASTVIEDLIRSLQKRDGGGSTYVMVTHQDSTIRRTTDQVIFLYKGQIQWQGSIEEAYRSDNPALIQFFTGSVSGPIQVVN